MAFSRSLGPRWITVFFSEASVKGNASLCDVLLGTSRRITVVLGVLVQSYTSLCDFLDRFAVVFSCVPRLRLPVRFNPRQTQHACMLDTFFSHFPPVSSASLHFSFSFFNFSSFHFFPFPSLFFSFSTIFQKFSFTSPHFLICPFVWLKRRVSTSPSLSARCPTTHKILRRTRHVVKEDFACFSTCSGTFKKRVLIW